MTKELKKKYEERRIEIQSIIDARKGINVPETNHNSAFHGSIEGGIKSDDDETLYITTVDAFDDAFDIDILEFEL